MYEPIWNRGYVDHVQITMAEDIGIGGRAGYYDGIGAALDAIQKHLLQLLALMAMEEPVAFDADSLRMEKEKVLSAVRLPADLATGTARGQYSAGWILITSAFWPSSSVSVAAKGRCGARWKISAISVIAACGNRLPARR